MDRIEVLHAIRGRLRIRAARLKTDVAAADALTDALRSLEGVVSVLWNGVTGSLVITYSPLAVSQASLLGELSRLTGEPVIVRSSRHRHRADPNALREVGNRIAGAVLKTAMEAAVQRALLALI